MSIIGKTLGKIFNYGSKIDILQKGDKTAINNTVLIASKVINFSKGTKVYQNATRLIFDTAKNAKKYVKTGYHKLNFKQNTVEDYFKAENYAGGFPSLRVTTDRIFNKNGTHKTVTKAFPNGNSATTRYNNGIRFMKTSKTPLGNGEYNIKTYAYNEKGTKPSLVYEGVEKGV